MPGTGEPATLPNQAFRVGQVAWLGGYPYQIFILRHGYAAACSEMSVLRTLPASCEMSKRFGEGGQPVVKGVFRRTSGIPISMGSSERLAR